MRHLPFVIAASLLLFAPAASGLRADPPPAPVGKATPVRVVNISMRLVKATERAARSLRLLGTARRPGDEPRYDPAALEQRLRCWERAGHAERVSAPRLTVYPEQKANISMLKPFTYLADYEVDTSMGPTNILDPVIQTIQEGLVVECTASLSGAGVALSAGLTVAVIKRPVEEFETTLASGGPKVKIQIPELLVRRVQRSTLLTPGRAALLGDLPPVPFETDRRVLLVWVEAEAIDIEPAQLEVEKQVEAALR